MGIVLRMIATGLEAMGDKAPVAAEGVSGERLVFHGAALALTIGALACFGWALYVLFRKRKKVSVELAQVFSVDASIEVEAEAAHFPNPSPAKRIGQPKGFGRKST